MFADKLRTYPCPANVSQLRVAVANDCFYKLATKRSNGDLQWAELEICKAACTQVKALESLLKLRDNLNGGNKKVIEETIKLSAHSIEFAMFSRFKVNEAKNKKDLILDHLNSHQITII